MTPSIQGMLGPALFDSTEIDAVAAIVRGCAGVSALDSGPFGEVASYLPGRIVPGVAVDDSRIRVQVRSEWGVPATDVAAQITAAVAPLAGPRPVDVTIADIDDPPAAQPTGAAVGETVSRRPSVVVGPRAVALSTPQPGGER
jgi:hypothetical protein